MESLLQLSHENQEIEAGMSLVLLLSLIVLLGQSPWHAERAPSSSLEDTRFSQGLHRRKEKYKSISITIDPPK